MSNKLNDTLFYVHKEKKQSLEALRQKKKQELALLMRKEIIPALIDEIEQILLQKAKEVPPTADMKMLSSRSIYVIPSSISRETVSKIQGLCDVIGTPLVNDDWTYQINHTSITMTHKTDSRISREVAHKSISDTSLEFFEPMVKHYLDEGFEELSIRFYSSDIANATLMEMDFYIKNPEEEK